MVRITPSRGVSPKCQHPSQGAPGGRVQRSPSRGRATPPREAGGRRGVCGLIYLGAKGDPRSPGYLVQPGQWEHVSTPLATVSVPDGASEMKP